VADAWSGSPVRTQVRMDRSSAGYNTL